MADIEGVHPTDLVALHRPVRGVAESESGASTAAVISTLAVMSRRVRDFVATTGTPGADPWRVIFEQMRRPQQAHHEVPVQRLDRRLFNLETHVSEIKGDVGHLRTEIAQVKEILQQVLSERSGRSVLDLVVPPNENAVDADESIDPRILDLIFPPGPERRDNRP